ncbi:lipase family alpha/beta hydrolase [Nocardia sp. NPDC127579]|uniref:lipase family alpha/beta hydrolase n=1 Tax=Nocardia sp. NPDC127579 TaxID=3345402 RepID=UPI0036459533
MLGRVRNHLLVAAALVLCATPPASAAQANPVLLVHGWQGSAGQFAPMRTVLEQAGFPVYAVELPGDENYANVRAIAAAVVRARQEHGGSRVDLVGHSMGGLSARYFLKYEGGTDAVRTYVSMGSAQRGYLPACVLPPDGGGQMCPANEFITRLNTGDPTPGPVTYTFLNSSLDSTRHDIVGGNWCRAEIPGVRHADEPGDPRFAAAVRKALAGECPR